jgi:hypothetical protein
MVPLTDLSAPIVIVPAAVADVVTGGVSSAPVKDTFTSVAQADPKPAAKAAATISVRKGRVLQSVFMGISVW